MIDILFVLLQLVLGVLLADFLSGVLHWLEDRFGRVEWPFIGPWVIAPNRRHHDDPLAFTRDNFFSRNGTTWLAVAIIAAPLFWMFGPAPWLVTAALVGAMANQIHYWAHVPARAPGLVRRLQALRILQSQRQHGAHHKPPHTRAYCTITGLLNPVLDTVRFWGLVESIIPRRWFA